MKRLLISIILLVILASCAPRFITETYRAETPYEGMTEEALQAMWGNGGDIERYYNLKTVWYTPTIATVLPGCHKRRLLGSVLYLDCVAVHISDSRVVGVTWH